VAGGVWRDVGQWLLVCGPRRLYVPLLLGPVRELLALVPWVRAPFERHVAWRGHRVRLSAGSVAYLLDRSGRAV
jgi:hypothetical protein